MSQESFYRVRWKGGSPFVERYVTLGLGMPDGATRQCYVLAPWSEDGKYDRNEVLIVSVGGIGSPEGWHQTPELAKKAEIASTRKRHEIESSELRKMVETQSQMIASLEAMKTA